MALAAALAHAPTASTKDVDEPPLTPSYPPSRPPGTKRAVGGEGMRGETHARSPLASGRWMLKRSEHLRRWNKRWVSLDETGESVIIKANPADEKALSSVRLADVSTANVSSHNFHGNQSYFRCCVHVETRGQALERGIFLVATSPDEASRWVADLRALAALEDPAPAPPPAAPSPSAPLTPNPPAAKTRPQPASKPRTREPASASSRPSRFDVAEDMREVLLSPGLTAPPTPVLITAPSRAFADASPADVSPSSASAGGSTPRSASASSVRSGASSARSGSGSGSRPAASGPAAWFVGSNARLASSFASVAEEFSRSNDQARAQMLRTSEMTREAMEAKDDAMAATRRLLEAEATVAREARGRADALQERLEEKAAALEKTRGDLEATAASNVSLRARLDEASTRADDETRRADDAVADLACAAKELADARDALATHREESARASAVERELRGSLAAAERRVEALAAERTAAAAEAHRIAAELRRDLEEAGERALRAAADAQRAVEEERDKVAVLEEELRRRRGIRALFAGPTTRGKTPTTARGRRPRASRGVVGGSASASASASGSASSVTEPLLGNGGATPEVTPAAPRRLFEYGTAPASPAEVIDHLDSPGAHGCRQM